MTEDTATLIRQAEAAVKAGQWAQAEKLWLDVRKRDPRNPKAAFSLGIHAMQRRDFREACRLLEQAVTASPQDPFMRLTLSKARREAGDDAGEAQAIDAVLTIDPYYLPALLAKGQRYERLGASPSAAMFYRNAVKVAGPELLWPDVLRQQLSHAKSYAALKAGELHGQLEAAIAPLMSGLNGATSGTLARSCIRGLRADGAISAAGQPDPRPAPAGDPVLRT